MSQPWPLAISLPQAPRELARGDLRETPALSTYATLISQALTSQPLDHWLPVKQDHNLLILVKDLLDLDQRLGAHSPYYSEVPRKQHFGGFDAEKPDRDIDSAILASEYMCGTGKH
jgi:hypothetical protein